jgi:hypothetical protein
LLPDHDASNSRQLKHLLLPDHDALELRQFILILLPDHYALESRRSDRRSEFRLAIHPIRRQNETPNFHRTWKTRIISYSLLFQLCALKQKDLLLSNGHSPQIRENGELLVRMCRGESHFFQKWPLANVGEFGESEQNRLANVDEFIESEQNRLANVWRVLAKPLDECWLKQDKSF